MTKKDKLLAKIRQNPKHVRFDDLEKILLALGFDRRQPGSSHVTFTLGKHIITIPLKKPFVKPHYVHLVIDFLDSLAELEKDDESR
jgi:hypothetical protein